MSFALSTVTTSPDSHAMVRSCALRIAVVNVYQKHWNRLVSPGEAVSAKNEHGQQMMSQAVRKGQLPDTLVHDKEVFL